MQTVERVPAPVVDAVQVKEPVVETVETVDRVVVTVDKSVEKIVGQGQNTVHDVAVTVEKVEKAPKLPGG